MYLDTAGELFMDEIALVPGSVPAVGTNLLANGGFESALAPAWQFFGTNGSNSTRSGDARLNGDFGLDLKFSAPGGANHFLYQDIPNYATTAVHTLSFWYLPSTNAANFVFRMSAGFRGTLNVRAAGNALGIAATPGTNNNYTTAIPPYPLVWLNEVLPVNTSGITDNQGQREPWIEVLNSSPNPMPLSDFFLSDDFSRLGKWRFPAGAVINPGEFKIIFADGEPAQTTPGEWHANFRLSASSTSLALSRLLNGAPQLIDYLNFENLPPTRSYGAVPDGQLFDRAQFEFVTPGAANNPASRPIAVYINEWMAANGGSVRDPADNDADDWFELYNAQSTAVDLGGYFLTDNLSNRFQFVVPNNGNYVIPPLGYLLVWADGEPGQNSTNRPDLHVNFQLRQGGEAIGLFAPDGSLVDAVTFGSQATDVSEGRYPAGVGPIYTMSIPTPRAGNTDPNTPPQIVTIFRMSATEISFSFSAISGRTYRVEYSENLGDDSWTQLGPNRVAANAVVAVQDSTAPGSQRFYRVLLLP
jgi:hypothetical protein